MKLISSFGPSPRMLRMYLAEQRLSAPAETADDWTADNRQDAYKKQNPAGSIPTLDLKDGTLLGETISICEYVEETLHPALPNVRGWFDKIAASPCATSLLSLNWAEMKLRE